MRTQWIEELLGYARSQVDDRVREALWARGVSDEQIKTFGFGYLNGHLPEIEGDESFRSWALRGDKLASALVIPLTNTLGEIQGLQLRSLDPAIRGYQDFFCEKFEPVLFGLGQALPSIWETQEIFIVEGAFDLCPVQRVFPNVVASLTARVSESFYRTLRRLVTHVHLFYDMDPTGRKNGFDFVQKAKGDLKVTHHAYPQVPLSTGKLTKDPAELWEAWGDERFNSAFRALVA